MFGNVAIKTFLLFYVVDFVIPKEKSTKLNPNTGCGDAQMNLVFVLDSSYSVTDANFQLAKSFITDIVQSLPVSETQVRVGLVRYGNSADVMYTLRQPADVKSVTGAIESMQHVKGSTNTAIALATLRLEVLAPEVVRPDVRTVVVVITDGESDNRQHTKAQARKLREQNVRLVWLYIGGNENSALRSESWSMKKEGDAIFTIDNFDALGDELELQILGASCKEDETTPASSKTETVPVTTSKTTLAPVTTSAITTVPVTTKTTTAVLFTTTTTPTTTIISTSTTVTSNTEQQNTTTTLPHTELASATTEVPIESSTLSEAPAAENFSKETTTVTQSLTTQEIPKNSNTTTLAPAVSTPLVAASTESNKTEIPATTSRTSTPAAATTNTATPAPITTTTPTTTLTSTAATSTTEQQDTTTTPPHTELASSTTGVLIESSTLSEAPAAVSFSKETTVTQALTTQETPINSNTTTLAPVVSTPSVASTESTAQIHAQATDANATQNRTDKPEADHSVPAITAGDQVSKGESAHSTYDGSTKQGSWQQDWMMSAGISAGGMTLVGVASGLGYVALRRWKQRRNKAGHDL